MEFQQIQVCNGGRPFDRAGELGSGSVAKKTHHLTPDHKALCGKRPKLSNKDFQIQAMHTFTHLRDDLVEQDTQPNSDNTFTFSEIFVRWSPGS